MRTPASAAVRKTQSGRAIAWLLGAVMLVAAALIFSRIQGVGGGGSSGPVELPPGLQADLQGFLEHWAGAFRSRDVTAHTGFYRDPTFYFGRSRTRQEIWLEKKNLLDTHPAIGVYEISELKVEKFEAGLATLTFTLRYDYGPGGAEPSSGAAVERLTCRSSVGDWKIESEYIEKEK
jgi:hypothetical protein